MTIQHELPEASQAIIDAFTSGAEAARQVVVEALAPWIEQPQPHSVAQAARDSLEGAIKPALKNLEEEVRQNILEIADALVVELDAFYHSFYIVVTSENPWLRPDEFERKSAQAVASATTMYAGYVGALVHRQG